VLLFTFNTFDLAHWIYANPFYLF